MTRAIRGKKRRKDVVRFRASAPGKDEPRVSGGKTSFGSEGLNIYDLPRFNDHPSSEKPRPRPSRSLAGRRATHLRASLALCHQSTPRSAPITSARRSSPLGIRALQFVDKYTMSPAAAVVLKIRLLRAISVGARERLSRRAYPISKVPQGDPL